jgi:hypothetical protein
MGDSTLLLGDVRYGGGSGNGFTDVRVPRRSAACPRGMPPWIPPREDLLEVPAGARIVARAWYDNSEDNDNKPMAK